MKILYIAYSCNPFNGSEDSIGFNIPWSNAMSNDVYVITRSDLKTNIEKLLNGNKKRNIKFYYVDVPPLCQHLFKGCLYSARLLFWNRNVYKLAKILCDNERIEIIHQITPVEFRAIGNYGKINNIKFIVGPVGGAENIPQPLMYYLKKKDKLAEIFRMCINCFFRKYLVISKKIDRCDYFLFANEETFQFLNLKDIASRSYIVSEIGIHKDDIISNKNINKKMYRPVFLVCGRIVYRKGHQLLLDALEQLDEHLDYECLIVGSGDKMAELEKNILSNKQLNKKVKIIGEVYYKEIQTMYMKADVLVLPSLRETTGTVILEALSKGVPLITSKHFGAQVILDEKQAWFYNGNTREEYVENLKEILEGCIKNPCSIQEKSAYSIAKAKNYIWEKKVVDYQNIYECLIKNSDRTLW